jgi:hypothetical protein
MFFWLPSLAGGGGAGGVRGTADGSNPVVSPSWPALLDARQSVYSEQVSLVLSNVQAVQHAGVHPPRISEVMQTPQHH